MNTGRGFLFFGYIYFMNWIKEITFNVEYEPDYDMAMSMGTARWVSKVTMTMELRSGFQRAYKSSLVGDGWHYSQMESLRLAFQDLLEKDWRDRDLTVYQHARFVGPTLEEEKKAPFVMNLEGHPQGMQDLIRQIFSGKFSQPAALIEE